MSITETFATTGRKMDAAWKKAISDGKKQATRGLKAAGIGAAVGYAAPTAVWGGMAVKGLRNKRLSSSKIDAAKFVLRPGPTQIIPAVGLAALSGGATGLYDALKKKPSVAERSKRAAKGAVKAYKNTK